MTLRTAPASVPDTVIWRQKYTATRDLECCYTRTVYRLSDVDLFPSPFHGRISAKDYRYRMETIKTFLEQYQLFPQRWLYSLLLAFLVVFSVTVVGAIFISPFFVAGAGALLIMIQIAVFVMYRQRLSSLQTEMQKIMDTFNSEDNRFGLYWRSYFSVTFERYYNGQGGNYISKIYIPAIDVSLVGEVPIPHATYVPIMPMDSSTPPPYFADNSAQVQHSNGCCK